jgi:hypothetical protein
MTEPIWMELGDAVIFHDMELAGVYCEAGSLC